MQSEEQQSKITSLGGSSDDTKRDRILSIASDNGIKYGLLTTALAGAGTLLAVAKHKRFRELTSASIRTSIPVMVGLATWAITYETTVIDAQRHPDKYNLSAILAKDDRPRKLPIYQRSMNYIYDHPFQLITYLSVPFAGAILYQQMGQTHLTISQRIMHSRVFAQAGVLAILLSTMGFLEYMDRRGKFPDPEEEIRRREH
eukprot:gene29400-35489_t